MQFSKQLIHILAIFVFLELVLAILGPSLACFIIQIMNYLSHFDELHHFAARFKE